MHFAIPQQFEFLTGSTTILFSGTTLKTIYLMHLLNKCVIEYEHEKQAFFLNSEVLKQLYGKSYKFYPEYLIQNNFIFKKRRYSATSHESNLYSFCAATISILHFRLKDYILEKKLKRLFDKNLKRVPTLDTTIPVDIRKRLLKDLKSVEIDCDS